MCDAERYSTGLLLVQVSASMLASVFFARAKVSTGSEEKLPVAETVEIEEVTAFAPEIENGISTSVPAVVPSPVTLNTPDQSRILRRRQNRGDSRTITMSAQQVQQLQFDF